MKNSCLVPAVVGLLVFSAALVPAFAGEVTVGFTFTPDDVIVTAMDAYHRVRLNEGALPVDEVGAPAIPAKYVNILVPAGAENIALTAGGEASLLAADIVPTPSQPRSPKSKPRPAFAEANSRYASAEAWPAAAATLEGVQDMQGFRFVSVRVNPLYYVGAARSLYLRPEMTVTVTYDLPAAPRTISSKQKAQFEPLVNSLVVNPSDAAAFAPAASLTETRAALDYLIITSPALSNAFQQLATYRASSAGGSYSTAVLTTNYIGSTYTGADIQQKIRACISNNVATMGTTMVVLGGDDTIVPDRDCYVAVVSGDTYETNMPTDLYYSGLGGNWNSDSDAKYGETGDNVDMAWDVIVARIPVRTAAQATNYINKVIAYDADSSRLADKIILGGPEAWSTYSGSSRPSDDVTIDGHAGFRSVSPAHTYVSDSEMWLRRLYRDGIYPYWPATVNIICDTITSWDGSTCGDHLESAANTLAAFNKNFTHLMFSGHGAPQEWGLESGSFDNTDAASMTGMAAFVYTDACLTGHFDRDSNSIDGYSYTTEPCLGEGFLRNYRNAGGAVVYMGCARYGWGEPDDSPASNTSDGGPSTVYGYKFYKRFHESNNVTVGRAFAMHKADMISLCGTDEAERWIQFGLNLLGDPALKLPVEVVPTNTPPVLAAIGNKSVTWSNTLQFAVTAAATDADPVTLTCSNKPAAATFWSSGTNGLFSWTNAGPVGVYTVSVYAADNDGADFETFTITVSAGGTASDLFISEYIEGASSEKYVEIFNGTGAEVDLSDYALVLFANGATTPTTSNILSGTLGHGSVAVYKNSSATNTIGTANSAVNFNGDDAIALWNRTSSSWADIFGRIGEDPGSAWTDGSFSTVDKTLVRKSTVSGGVTSNPGSGFPTLGTEWDQYNQNVEDYLGSHTFGGGGSTPTAAEITITDPASASTSVAYATSTYDVSGTCNTAAVGQIRWTNSLTGATGSTAAFTGWTIGGVALNVGNNTIFVSVTNASGTVASDSVIINRAALVATNKPTIRYTPEGTNQSVTVSNALSVTVTATDDDGETVSLVPSSLPAGSAFTGRTNAASISSEFTWTPTVTGTYSAAFKAEDNDGAVTSRIQIVVTESSAGGGTETFANFSAGGSYVSGTFAGQDGSTWNYSLARGDLSLNGSSPTLSRAANAFVRSGT
ncbi:MAG: lamin tail domain-containing protein, partial [Acidobacteria bacterium]|nr:lamin tail domain-containing protein [Acidobacteriota bacterium]